VLSAADKQSKWRKPSPGVWVLLAGSLILVAVFLRNNMKAARIEEVLRQEFSALGSPPGATLVGMESHHKPGVVFIGHTFSFSSDFRTVSRSITNTNLPGAAGCTTMSEALVKK
jgi:hypothetical protein